MIQSKVARGRGGGKSAALPVEVGWGRRPGPPGASGGDFEAVSAVW